MANRKADPYHHSHECIHRPTHDVTPNSENEDRGEIKEKTNSAHQEKIRVVIVSIIASSGLMILKLSIGALTNSLGILSEGMNSGLDLVAG